MHFFQKQHAQPALADAAADGQGQLARQQHLVEGKAPPLVAARQGQLPVQGRRVHPDAHAADLHRALQRLVPEQKVAVQAPVVIIRGAAVVGLAALQLAADLLDEDGAVLLGKGVFPLFGGKVRPAVLQLLAGDKGHLPAQAAGELGKLPFQFVQSGADGVDDVLHRGVQILPGALVRVDDLLPVPLVHIHRVEVIQFLVPADGVHVGEQAVAGAETVLMQGQPLPLGQTVHHLGADAGGGDVKAHRALHAVQVVVQAQGRVHEQGGGDPLEVQRRAQLDLEGLLDHANGLLGVVKAQAGHIALGDGILAHQKHLA